MNKQLPFFRKETLIFEESGHSLRISDRHYRCDSDCKGKCDADEPQIKTDTLEKAFTRLCEGFEIDSVKLRPIRKEVLKTYFVDILLENLDEKDAQQELIDTTISAMNADNKIGTKIERTDISEVEDAFAKIQELDYPVLLFGYFIGMLTALSSESEPVERARNIALVSESIYLSKDGKIVAISFERWGWYILKFIQRYNPEYLSGFDKVKILNYRDELLDLDFGDALHYFDDDNFEEALHNHEADQMYTVFKMMKDMTGALVGGGKDEMQNALVILMTQLTQLPVAEFATRVKPLMK